jgi:hypothetical protein
MLARDKMTQVEALSARNQARVYSRAIVMAMDATGRPHNQLDACALVAALRSMDRALTKTLDDGGSEFADELANEIAAHTLAQVGLSLEGKH